MHFNYKIIHYFYAISLEFEILTYKKCEFSHFFFISRMKNLRGTFKIVQVLCSEKIVQMPFYKKIN